MYGDVFNDICVYSDVCSIMASAQHRIQARRILQELFLDAPFSEVSTSKVYLTRLGTLVGTQSAFTGNPDVIVNLD